MRSFLSCVALAQQTLATQWGGYEVDHTIKRVRTPPQRGPPIYVPIEINEEHKEWQRMYLFRHRQLCIRQCTLALCVIRVDGHIENASAVPFSLDYTWSHFLEYSRVPRRGDQCRVWPVPARLMDPWALPKFNKLVTLAMDAQRSLQSVGLIEMYDIMNRLGEKLSVTMAYDMQVYAIYVWSPASSITFMNSSKYDAECLSGPVPLGGFAAVDIKVWSQIAAMYVWRMSRGVMPFPKDNIFVRFMPEDGIDMIDELTSRIDCPSSSSCDDFLSGEVLLDAIMHKRATYCREQVTRSTFHRPCWFRSADKGNLKEGELVTGDTPIPDLDE
jgi:hypothetical protein